MIFDHTHTLNKQVAVVVGGSGAIGSAICRHFANAGATCIVTYNSGKEAAQALVTSLPGNVHWAAHVPVDDSATLDALAADVQAKHGRLDVLVNCAAITRYVPHNDLDALDDRLIDDIFRDTDFVKGLDKKWRDEQAARTPLKRLATADEIGAATLAVVAHLRYSTGCIIAIDGGRPLA